MASVRGRYEPFSSDNSAGWPVGMLPRVLLQSCATPKKAWGAPCDGCGTSRGVLLRAHSSWLVHAERYGFGVIPRTLNLSGEDVQTETLDIRAVAAKRNHRYICWRLTPGR